MDQQAYNATAEQGSLQNNDTHPSRREPATSGKSADGRTSPEHLSRQLATLRPLFYVSYSGSTLKGNSFLEAKES